MRKNNILFISSSEIKELLTMKDSIELMKEAFIQLSKKEIIAPQRITMNISDKNGDVLFMPAYSNKREFVSLKIVSIYKNNLNNNLPKIQALIILINSENGKPVAMMDGELITAMRTGAVSGLATDLLSRKDSKIAAIFGTSKQAEKQLEAIVCVRKLIKVYVFGTSIEKSEMFVETNKRKYNFELLSTTDKEHLINCDIICTATSSNNSVFNNKFLKEGVHINSIGSYKPEMNEIPEETIVNAKLVVDSKSACLNEAGDIIKPIEKGLINSDHIYAELGDIVSGKKFGRENEKELTVFKSVGLAIQDLFVSSMIYNKSISLNKGQILEL